MNPVNGDHRQIVLFEVILSAMLAISIHGYPLLFVVGEV